MRLPNPKLLTCYLNSAVQLLAAMRLPLCGNGTTSSLLRVIASSALRTSRKSAPASKDTPLLGALDSLNRRLGFELEQYESAAEALDTLYHQLAEEDRAFAQNLLGSIQAINTCDECHFASGISTPAYMYEILVEKRSGSIAQGCSMATSPQQQPASNTAGAEEGMECPSCRKTGPPLHRSNSTREEHWQHCAPLLCLHVNWGTPAQDHQITNVLQLPCGVYVLSAAICSVHEESHFVTVVASAGQQWILDDASRAIRTTSWCAGGNPVVLLYRRTYGPCRQATSPNQMAYAAPLRPSPLVRRQQSQTPPINRASPQQPASADKTSHAARQIVRSQPGKAHPKTTNRRPRARGGAPLVVASWNVRTMAARIEVHREELSYVGETGKEVLLTSELQDRGIHLLALQEHRWSMTGQQKIGLYTWLLVACNTSPYTGGVAILLHCCLLSPEYPIQVLERSPRILGVRLHINGEPFTVYCAYAPIYRRGCAESALARATFWADLETAVRQTPKTDRLLVLGDLNSQVGTVRASEPDGITGPFGSGIRNEAGNELHQFCAEGCLRVMNTYFRHRTGRTITWTHPMFRLRAVIDYLLMRPIDHHMCLDVHAEPGARLHSDHRMVVARLRVQGRWRRWQQRNATPQAGPVDISKLSVPEVATRYERSVAACVARLSPDAPWESVRDAIAQAGRESLGTVTRNAPRRQQWQIAHADELRVLQQRVRNSKTRAQCKAAHKATRRRIREITREWWQDKLSSMEQLNTQPRSSWSALRDLGVFFAPTGSRAAPNIIVDPTGMPITDPAEVDRKWTEHFRDLLNTISVASPAALTAHAASHTMSTRVSDAPPDKEEVMDAISQLKRWKAPGPDDLPAELLRGSAVVDALHRIITDAWHTHTIPQGWKDATLVPIPKKGDRRQVSNWRGICLLAAAGKVLSNILRTRILPIQDSILPESQCGFRKNRSCIDAIHCMRYLAEMTAKHPESTLHTIYVDLQKAYDSVPRAALWDVLKTYGTPPNILALIKALHDGMEVRVRISGRLLPPIAVQNGVRQGCVLAPTLFNIFYSAVLAHWARRISPTDGVSISYNIDGALTRIHANRNCNVSGQRQGNVHSLVYADDTALVSTTWTSCNAQWKAYVTTMQEWGLVVNIAKTKVMTVGADDSNGGTLIPEGTPQVERVSEFTYLGSKMTAIPNCKADINARITASYRAFGILRSQLWYAPLPRKSKMAYFKMAVCTVLLYGAEAWTLSKWARASLRKCYNGSLRKILHLPWPGNIEDIPSNATIRKLASMPDIIETLHRRAAQWMGHVARMEVIRLPKQLTFSWLPEQPPQPAVIGQKRHTHQVLAVFRCLGISPLTWYDQAQDRKLWHNLTQEGKWADIAYNLRSHPDGMAASNKRTRGRARNERIEGGQLNVHCPYPGCVRAFVGKTAAGEVAKHYNYVHRNRDSSISTIPTILQCPHPGCLFVTTQQTMHTVHVNGHSQHNQCPHCDREFRINRSLTRHLRYECRATPTSEAGKALVARGITPDLYLHQCERCRKNYVNGSGLQKHTIAGCNGDTVYDQTPPVNCNERYLKRQPRSVANVLARSAPKPPPMWATIATTGTAKRTRAGTKSQLESQMETLAAAIQPVSSPQQPATSTTSQPQTRQRPKGGSSSTGQQWRYQKLKKQRERQENSDRRSKMVFVPPDARSRAGLGSSPATGTEEEEEAMGDGPLGNG